jgi:hypothetical protein
MNDFRIHRDPEAIAGLKLVWDKLLSETRHGNFTQSWNWFQLATRLWKNDFQPLVIEARFSGKSIGLLPFLTDLRQNRWVSPQSLFGFGQAAPVGQSTTAIWMTAARLLRDSLSKSLTWELGPFPHGTGSSSRVTTVFSQLALPTLSSSHFELPVSELHHDSIAKTRGGSTEPARQNWKTLLGFSPPPHDGSDRSSITSCFSRWVSRQGLPLGSYGRTRNLTATDFEFLIDTFFERGWIHLFLNSDFGGCLVLGDPSESYLVPCGFHSLSEAARRAAMQEVLGLMQQAGFQRTTLVSRDPILSQPFLLRRKQHAYQYVARKTAQTTLRHFWNRLTTAS